ncbi:hypothetical protein BGW80DRAFT_1323987, partial [Lactifluus volemus]
IFGFLNLSGCVCAFLAVSPSCPLLTCSVAPIRVATIPLSSMSLPLTFSSEYLALAIPLPAFQFLCYTAPLYIITSLPTHACLSLFALDSLIGCPPTDHRLWPATAPRF